jgi:hypothetical protein
VGGGMDATINSSTSKPPLPSPTGLNSSPFIKGLKSGKHSASHRWQPHLAPWILLLWMDFLLSSNAFGKMPSSCRPPFDGTTYRAGILAQLHDAHRTSVPLTRSVHSCSIARCTSFRADQCLQPMQRGVAEFTVSEASLPNACPLRRHSPTRPPSERPSVPGCAMCKVICFDNEPQRVEHLHGVRSLHDGFRLEP